MHPADAWTKTLRAVGARGDLSGAGAALLARYTEPHRHYHTVGHLADVLAGVDELADVATDIHAVRLAALFHDAVYDPLRDDNEHRSADLAVSVLGILSVEPGLVAEVARLVRLTADHETGPDDRDGAVLCDADLAVLARGPAGYDAYVRAVRSEYQLLDEPTWRTGRAGVLRRLLARPRLYRTARYTERFEAAARANLMGELAALTSAGEAPTHEDGEPAPGS